MKTLRFVISLIITLVLTLSLNMPLGDAPPLGKFLSPFQGFWKNAQLNMIDTEEEITLEGLTGPVSVYYDEIMIPHIFAENEHDLRVVQGYLTAKDRLWQMDFYARVVFGRLSEVLGKRALDYDRLQRRIGLKYMTEESYRKLQENPVLNEAFDAYAEGVNAYLDRLSYRDLPLEFKLLDYEPERWSAQKSCIGYALLSNTLSRDEADLENTNARILLGENVFNLLFPELPPNPDPVIPKGTRWNFSPVTVPPSTYDFSIKTKTTLEKPNPLNGSNNFVVSGKKTRSGHVILANEPDLNLTLPSIWHASHLNTTDLNVMGVTVPGTPMILIGFNDSIAWGVTNSPRDQVDWYSIRFRDETRNEYLYNNQWFKTEKRVEEFKIRDEPSFYDTLVIVHHGPVVYDRNYLGNSEKVNYAMKWVAHEPSSSFSTLYKINQALDHSAFVEALRYFMGPPQNFIFGSRQGTIAIHLPGKFPVKWEGQGKFLMDGSQPGHEWKAYIPFEHHLRNTNPEKGFLSSANQHQVDSLYPYYVYDYNYEVYRNRRINDRLMVMNNIEPQDLMKLQHDNYNYKASESLPMMLAGLDTAVFTPEEHIHFTTLKGWDYFNNADSKAATLYQIWWGILYNKIWDEFDTITVEVNKPEDYTTIHLLSTNPENSFFDMISTPGKEGATELYRISFQKTLDSLESWISRHDENYQWHRFKNTSIRHLLRLEPLSKETIPIGGYSGIVNAAAASHGPSWRMVVELTAEGPKAWGVYPGSQTGNAGSLYYAHMIEKWAGGEYFALLFGRDLKDSEQVIFSQTFNAK